jgi:Concanavalin A-like lectin/glucanases superfamily
MIVQGVTLSNISVYDNTFNTKNALLYIDIGNSASYPGSGTTYTDLSSNANNGTSAGSPAYSNQYGGYSSFNGSGSQYIATPTAKWNQTYTGKTVFIVARLTAITAGTYRCLFGTAAGTRNFNTYIWSPSSGVYQIHFSSAAYGGYSNNIPLVLGQWFSLAVTQTASGAVTYYFNGQVVGTDTGTFSQWYSNGNENIAAGDNYWYGDIAVCAVYGRALSTNEIQQDHNALSIRGYFDVVTSNLAIWIDANSAASYPGTGTNIKDLSGNNRTQNLLTASQFGSLSGVKYFDCSGSYGIAAHVVTPTLPTTGFTYIAWARMIASSATFRTLFRTYPNDHPLLINVGTDDLGMWDNSVSIFYPCGFSVAGLADTWVQWAVTGDSSGQTFYVNGQNVGSVTAQTAAGNSHNITGNVGLSAATQPFGYVSNMLLYTSKLTATQIQQKYTASRYRYGV